MTENSAILVRNASKKFGEFLALDHISFEAKKGQVISLIGPSGSGKSTFLRLLNGLETTDAGTVEVASSKKKIGMVFQQFNLFPHLTVLANVTLAPVQVLGLSRRVAEEKAQLLLEKMGVLDQQRKYPAELSGGQQQRVAIVRSLMMDPELLLFDEPTSALDPERVAEVLLAIQSLAHTGITLVIATHEMRFARAISDRIVFFDQGKILADESPNQLFDRPPHPRIKEFLGRVLSFG